MLISLPLCFAVSLVGGEPLSPLGWVLDRERSDDPVSSKKKFAGSPDRLALDA
jgi:hypothetical protein